MTVILPEFVPKRLWQHLLHNQHALLIKGALLFKPNVVVTSVPFHLGRVDAAMKAAEPGDERVGRGLLRRRLSSVAAQRHQRIHHRGASRRHVGGG